MRNLELDCDINFRLSRLGWYYVNIYLLYCVGFFRQRTSDRCLWSRGLSIKFKGLKFQGVTQNLSWYLERIVFPRYWFLSHRYLMQLGACVLLLCGLLFILLINYSKLLFFLKLRNLNRYQFYYHNTTWQDQLDFIVNFILVV